MAKKPEVGRDIDAWCNPCKLVLAHVVVSLKGTRAHRVECKTCGAVHAYRKSVPGTRKKATPKAPKKTEYESLMEGRDVSKPLPYAMSAKFKVDDLIDHPKFGLGLVTELLDSITMKVVFPEGMKRLACSRP